MIAKVDAGKRRCKIVTSTNNRSRKKRQTHRDELVKSHRTRGNMEMHRQYPVSIDKTSDRHRKMRSCMVFHLKEKNDVGWFVEKSFTPPCKIC